jgi:hypothetical protein
MRGKVEEPNFAKKTLRPGEIFDLVDLDNPIEQKINNHVSLRLKIGFYGKSRKKRKMHQKRLQTQ